MDKELVEKCVRDIIGSISITKDYIGLNLSKEEIVRGSVISVNLLWKKITRWRDLTNDPPKYNGKEYRVLLKHIMGGYEVGVITTYHSAMGYKNKGYAQWKHIEIDFDIKD